MATARSENRFSSRLSIGFFIIIFLFSVDERKRSQP